VRSVQTAMFWGLTAQLALLAALTWTVGLDWRGWVVGVACGVVTNALLARGLIRGGSSRPGPADRVTLARATLVGGVAALVVDSLGQQAPVAALVTLTVVALVLDGVDGWVARRTGSASELGARFDMEVDAFLILVLSVAVAPAFGWWVLAIGGARYLFVAAGWVLPWMRGSLPPRYWRKVVAATQGIVLIVAVADVLPEALVEGALVVSLVLLVESFGRDVWWLWRHRDNAPREASAGRALAGVTVTVLAFMLVWFALVAPNEINLLRAGAFVRIPLEALLFVALILVLPARARRIVAVVIGLALGLLVIVKILDMGFFVAFGRSFNPTGDWTYFGSAVDLLSLSVGRREATLALVASTLAAVGVLVLMPLAVLRLSRVVERHPQASLRGSATLGVAWIALALLGLQLVPGAPVASASAAGLALDHVSQVRDGIEDQQTFAEAAAVDPLRSYPTGDLLTGLRGKDVIVAFVESYGRVAVQDSDFSPSVDDVLAAGTRELAAAGFSSRSAFLTSSTFGGLSWLAHSTLQSGLWIDNQQRYDDLVSTDRQTLTSSFARAGWRTVAVVPSNEKDWPEGTTFYHHDKIYDARNMGYLGLKFSYAAMPDQYILSAYQRLELAAPHDPVMAEIDLVSSHTPWTPLPRLVDWSNVGNGSVFDTMAVQGQSVEQLWRDPIQVAAAYGKSIEYSLSSLVSFVRQYGNDNTVLIVVGDHQPSTIVSGPGAGHDVPISIIARDPAVMERISGWQWQQGLLPQRDAPVWRMDSFRDRFLTAFSGHAAE
jgi:phosphatidylglycerophosphate synthase